MIGHLSNKQIEEVLKGNILGRIGCNDGQRTYVVPVNYVFEGNFIICHSEVGLKIRMMRKNPNVCFEVDEIKGLRNWKSVILWGTYEELTDEMESYNAIKLFVDRMMHMKISETAMPPETAERRMHPRAPGSIRAVVYRINIAEKTGRYEKK